jgi:hypothetical protein
MKGISEDSFIKHAELKRLALAQTYKALNSVLKAPRSCAAIIDMHAGDGNGVPKPQGELFESNESHATPVIALEIAQELRAAGKICDVFLCEKVDKQRERLEPLAQRYDAALLGDHNTLREELRKGYQWALVFNDPNGPREHGDAVLQWLARKIPKSDFIIVVNEGAIEERILNVIKPSTHPQAPKWCRTWEGIAEVHAKYRWRLNAINWALRLERNCVLRASSRFGKHAMKGRILLVSNSPITRKGYESLTASGNSTNGTGPASEKSAADRARGRG